MDKTKDNMKRNVSPETLVLHVLFYIWKRKVDFVEKIKEDRRKQEGIEKGNREEEQNKGKEEGNSGGEERGGTEDWSDTLSKSYSTSVLFLI